jgi:CRP/FNR family transcriptional regulator, cyclic AMP receptor protein
MSDPLFARFGREYRAGDVLFREGEGGEEMFVLQGGTVQITKNVGGEERLLAMLGRGDFVGEMAILNGKPRTATVTVVEDARVLVIDAKTLETMIAKNTEIAMRLIKKLARRLDAADEMIQILMNPDPRARVMLGLKRHASAFGQPTPEGGIDLRVGPTELATEVGTSPADAMEVLSRLKRLHIADVVTDATGRFNIVVEDVGRLLEFLEFLEMPKKFEGS